MRKILEFGYELRIWATRRMFNVTDSDKHKSN